MAAVIPAIGLGLSAAGTVASISAQSKQAKAQAASLEAQSQLNRQRLFQAQQQAEITKQYAGLFRTQQLELNAQEAQMTRLQLQEDMIRQMQTLQEARAQNKLQKAQSYMQADELLANAANLRTQAETQNANDSKQLGGMLGQIQDATTGAMAQSGLSGRMKQGLETNSLMAMMGLTEDVMQNVNTRNRVTDINAGAMTTAAGFTRSQADIISNATDQSLGMQQRLWNSQNVTGRRLLELQRQRNSLAINAQYEGQLADANAFNLAQSMQAQYTDAQIGAAKSQIQRPGILSYLTGAANIATQAYQLGLFRFGSGVNQPQSSSGTQFGITQNSALDGLLSGQPTNYSKFAELTNDKFKFNNNALSGVSAPQNSKFKFFQFN